MHASRRDTNDDHQYARNPGGVSVRMRTAIICLIAAIAVFAALSCMYIYARSQYTAGLLDGYKAGETQGKQEALVGLQQWQYAHKCETTLDDFVSLKLWRDGENHYQFDCIVGK